MIYKDYLKTEDWRKKKELKKLRAKNRCAFCGDEENLDTHHLQYKNLFDVRSGDLRFLCRRCHYLTHDLMKEGKIKFKDKHTSQQRFIISRNKVRDLLGLDFRMAKIRDRKKSK